MKFGRYTLSVGVLTLLLACFVGGGIAQDRPVTEAAKRPQVPNLILKTLDGREWPLHENRGSITVLNFWATWCAPCRTEVPMLVKLADEYEARGLKVVGIAMDEGSRPLIEKFAAEYKIDYPVVVPPPGSPLARIENMPTTLLIDGAGRLAQKYIGAVTEEALRSDINKLIAEQSKEAGTPEK